MENIENYKFLMPKQTYIGVNAIERLEPELKKYNITKCLLVTDKGIINTDIITKVKDFINKLGIDLIIYSGVTPNPTINQVNEGVKSFIENKCNAIISLGGGSPHDCAKVIKHIILKGNLNSTNEILLIAINTTAGTASEITQFAVITDEETHKKFAIVDEKIIPDIAVDDSSLMLGMPKRVTAETGMDALTHAIEAYVSKRRNYITNCTSIEAINLINSYLYKAYSNGKDLKARDAMVYAQYLAGMAFSNAGLGVVHAMSHQLSAVYNLPHGLCNAVLLPYGVKYNISKGCMIYGDIAKKLNICTESVPNLIAGKKLVEYINNINLKLNIPSNIKELGVEEKDLEKMTEMAMKDPILIDNPVEMNVDDIKNIYEMSYNVF